MGYRDPRGSHPESRGYDLRDLADMYEVACDFVSTEANLRRALEYDQARLGENHPQIAAKLGELSELYQFVGNYPDAEPFRLRAVEILRMAHGEGDSRYAQESVKLARLYQASGAYQAAEEIYRKAVETLIVAHGRDDSRYAAALIEQSNFYRAMGNYAAAEAPLREAIDISRRQHGEETPNFAFVLYHLAGFCLSSGDYAAAKDHFRRVLEIDRATLGAEDPDVAASMNNLAHVNIILGEHADAEPLLREAEQILRAARGWDHPDNASVIFNLVWVLAATGRSNEAAEMMARAGEIDNALIGQIAAIGSESQRMGLLKKIRSHVEIALSLILLGDGQSSEALASGLDLVLRRKALGAELLAIQRDFARKLGDPVCLEAVNHLARLRQRMAREVLAGPGPEGADEYGRQVKRLKREMCHVEVELSHVFLNREIREIRQGWWDADRNRVAQGLPEGSVLVEFVRLHIFNFGAGRSISKLGWGPARYLALVLPAREPSRAGAIDLGEADPIDRMIAHFLGQIAADEDVPAARDMVAGQVSGEGISPLGGVEIGPALRAAVFDPLTQMLGARTRLLLAPEGDLCRLPFEVLPDASGRPLIEDYVISYLSCGRDILRFGAPATVRPTAPIVAADPDFDLSAVSDGPVQVFGSRRRGCVARDLVSGGLAFARLTGSRREGKAVARLLGVRPWLDAEVLEGRLKADCRSPLILHISTHGFFLADHDDSAGGPGPFALIPKREANPTAISHRFTGPLPENPLLRSGLALAGANTWLKAGNPPEDAEDGLLTADDVIALDLMGTELVVLSACETGLGQIEVGEGVFGLRRAFVLAGAKTLVMSLWKVPDEPTCELMQDFYRLLLAGIPRADALREAQLASKSKDPNPFSWGAFICQGDPGPLVIK
jgi:tetratricopeptide (TPR) repeat protein